MKAPASVLVLGLVSLVSAVYALITGTLGLEFFDVEAPRSLVLISAVVHVYVGFGLLAGDAFARQVALWLLGLSFLASWLIMGGHNLDRTMEFEIAATHIVSLLVVSFFAWHLSGHGALEHAGVVSADHSHGDHGHAEHGH